jgi:hypothetical protein
MNKFIVEILRSALVILCYLTTCSPVISQEFTGNAIKVSFGIGSSSSSKTGGPGFVHSIGYQKDLKNDRFRFNPNLSFGRHSTKLLPVDARDQYFNSISMQSNLYYDLLKSKSTAMVLGFGGLINHTRGLLGTGGDPGSPSSEFVSAFHIGGYIGWGFRTNKPNKKTAVSIMPINVNIGTGSFIEYNARIEFDFKL